MPAEDLLFARPQRREREKPHPQRQKRVAHQQRAWRISIALFAIFCAATASIHSVLQDSAWWFALGGVVFAVLGAAAIARALSERRWVPTLVSFFALVGVMTLFFARGTALLFIVPTPGTVINFGALAHEGGASIAGQSVPAEATLGVIFLLCFGTGVLAVVADLIAITWRRPALAALPLAAIVGIPTAIGTQLADVFFIVLTGVCWLVLLRAGDPFAQTSRTLGVGALAVAVALFVPLVLPQVDESSASGDGFGGYLASVNPVLALGDELRRGLPRTILMYSTESGDPNYLRLVSLQNFQPETWQPDPPSIDLENVPSDVGAPPGLAAEVRSTEETTWVDISNLGSPWLPVPYPATQVRGLRGDWYWNATDLTFTSPDRVAKGEEYWVSSVNLEPTPAQLETASGAAVENSTVPQSSVGAENSTAAENPNAADSRYRELPADLPAIIGDTAREVTASAASDYARAVALQEYFRQGSFAYSETAPVDNGYDSNGMTAIAQFLDAKSGYCIHFASAMAVMARTLDIPSRVTVGFLPGEKQPETKDTETKDGRTTYRVSTQDVHAWPELYFEGIGWTRFEPTPGRGFVPSYADEATPGVPITPNINPTPDTTATPSAAPTRSAAPLDQADDEAASGSSTNLFGWLVAGFVILCIALLLLVPAAVRVAERAIRIRSLSRGHPAATTLWRELLQSAMDLGIDISDTSTPREVAAVIAHSARLGVTDQTTLAAIVGLVERQSFAGELPKPVSASAAREANTGEEWGSRMNSVLDRLRSASGWRTRVRAVIAPRSIWSRSLGRRS